jgi:hypothetical protein
MPKPQLYFVRDGKTYREANNGEIYILDGVASNVQKSALTNWLKAGYFAGNLIPEPWRLDGDGDDGDGDVVEDQDNEVIVEDKVDEIFEAVKNPEPIISSKSSILIKPVIYNIKQVPDDRRRSGYTEYRRL